SQKDKTPRSQKRGVRQQSDRRIRAGFCLRPRFHDTKKLLRRKKSCCVAQPNPLQHGKPYSAIRNIDVNLLILME
ncbi:hypothetical protein, partial [Burkholderia mallei]|uniref:hypothetical protein n=1 Tax=Burkholderia mallei TaxID=13373 RepID=UPI001C536BA1